MVEVTINMAIQSLFCRLFTTIVKPAVDLVASPIITGAIDALNCFLPTAFVVGAGINRGFTVKGIPFAAGANLEYVRSLSNGNSAWYVAPNVGWSNQGNNISASVFAGLVWGAESSEDYAGGFLTVSIGYKRLPRRVQKFVDRMLLTIGTKYFHIAADPKMVDYERFIYNEKLEEFKREIANNSSNELLVNVSIGKPATSITLSYDFTFSSNRKRSAAVKGSIYWQVWPWGEDVPFTN